MSGPDVAELLDLKPMPAEGGMWAQTWRDANGTAIYFLLQPDDFSALHRLEGPELWHHYAGDAVDMVLLHPDGTVERPVLGDHLERGERPFVAVPTGVWMGAATAREWSLVGTTMSPPFAAEQFELGDREDLIRSFPAAAADVVRLTRAVER